MSALDLLTGDAQTFTEKVWASRVHVHRASGVDVDRMVGVLTLDDVDQLLTGSGIRTPAVRLAHDGSVLASSKFTRSASLAGVAMTGLVDPPKALDLFDDGATLVLQGLHRYWPPLTDLVRELELALGHPCQANAYLTPPGSQGFSLHSDTHDVFVVQTHGRKLWEVHDDAGDHEVRMEPGTSMYLPTGTPHAAHTEDSASLHVTVGINQVTWRQVLDRTLQRLLDDEDAGAALPAAYVDDPGVLTSELGRRLHALADRLAATDAAEVATREVDHFLTHRASAVRGGLRDRLAVRVLADHTPLRRRPHTPCLLRMESDRLRVLLGDRELRVPRRLLEPLEHVRSVASLRPSDLAPWLDEQSRLVLARRLVREGLLEVTE